jgi:hypothetical protein
LVRAEAEPLIEIARLLLIVMVLHGCGYAAHSDSGND